MDCEKKVSPSSSSNSISTRMTTLLITLKVNNAEFLSQTEKQVDDTKKTSTIHFMIMKKTIMSQSAKSETTSIKCKQNLVVNESIDAKNKDEATIFSR